VRNDKWVGHADMVGVYFKLFAHNSHKRIINVIKWSCFVFFFPPFKDLSVRSLRQGSLGGGQHDRCSNLRRCLAFVERSLPTEIDRSTRQLARGRMVAFSAHSLADAAPDGTVGMAAKTQPIGAHRF